MKKEKKKMLFEVQENETLSQCLDRIKNEGYVAVRRTEKPIFEEIENSDGISYIPIGRQIIFEAKRID